MNIEEIIGKIEELRNGSFKANDWKFYLEEFVFSPDLLAIFRQAQADRATVEKLPLTADGVPIVPGMEVFLLHEGDHPFIDERTVIGPYGQAALLVYSPPRNGCGQGSAHWLANRAYSNRQSAIDAARIASLPKGASSNAE